VHFEGIHIAHDVWLLSVCVCTEHGLGGRTVEVEQTPMRSEPLSFVHSPVILSWHITLV